MVRVQALGDAWQHGAQRKATDHEASADGGASELLRHPLRLISTGRQVDAVLANTFRLCLDDLGRASRRHDPENVHDVRRDEADLAAGRVVGDRDEVAVQLLAV